jgi:hypothetical protein
VIRVSKNYRFETQWKTHVNATRSERNVPQRSGVPKLAQSSEPTDKSRHRRRKRCKAQFLEESSWNIL